MQTMWYTKSRGSPSKKGKPNMATPVTSVPSGIQVVPFERSKKVKMLDGSEVVRTAKGNMLLPASAEEANKVFGESLWKWAVEGFRQRALISVQNKLLGLADATPEQKKLSRKLRKQFSDHIRTLTQVMDFAPADAVDFLLKKDQFQPLIALMASLRAGSEEYDIAPGDVSQPEWFSTGSLVAEEPEEEESEDNE